MWCTAGGGTFQLRALVGTWEEGEVGKAREDRGLSTSMAGQGGTLLQRRSQTFIAHTSIKLSRWAVNCRG
jgi:hypothetical protein